MRWLPGARAATMANGRHHQQWFHFGIGLASSSKWQAIGNVKYGRRDENYIQCELSEKSAASWRRHKDHRARKYGMHIVHCVRVFLYYGNDLNHTISAFVVGCVVVDKLVFVECSLFDLSQDHWIEPRAHYHYQSTQLRSQNCSISMLNMEALSETATQWNGKRAKVSRNRQTLTMATACAQRKRGNRIGFIVECARPVANRRTQESIDRLLSSFFWFVAIASTYT